MSHEPPKAFDLTQEAADLRAELEHVKARVAELEGNLSLSVEAGARAEAERDAALLCLEKNRRVTSACGPDQVVILREDYERLIASLPAGPRLIR